MNLPDTKVAKQVADAATVPPARDRHVTGTGESEDLIGKVVAGRYRVEALLGSGGMGTVYRAQHVHMRKTVALKVLHRPMLHLPEMVARFEREAIAAARIDHPHVAAATDCGRLDDGLLYLVLEYVEGKSLQRLMAEDGVLSPARALTIARQIAEALNAAHATGIVHRDLKPDNVMLVARVGQAEFVKVLDFGIAKLVLDDNSRMLTQMGSVFGTPEYMSPEQALGATVDHRSDLYSLGVVLYQMLSGRTPFAADDPVAILAQHMTAEPPALPATVPSAVARLVLRLLAKDPADRLQTADETCREIDALPAFSPGKGAAGIARRELASRSTNPLGLRWLAPLAPAARFATKPLRVGRLRMPLWALAGVLLAGAAVWSAANGGELRGAARPTAGATSSSIDARHVAQAAVANDLGPGTDFAAISRRIEEVEALPVYKRSRDDWFLLARGHAELGRLKESVTSYRSVLKLDRSLRRDPVVLADLRRAGQSLETYRVVVNFCEGLLGENGPELLYQLWLDTRGDPSRGMIAETVLKKLEILSLRASPALRVAIELEVGKSCEKLLSVLARAVTHADQRSAERLTELNRKTGCGPNQAEDCWPCLRTDGLVGEALERARTRPAPPLGREPEPNP